MKGVVTPPMTYHCKCGQTFSNWGKFWDHYFQVCFIKKQLT